MCKLQDLKRDLWDVFWVFVIRWRIIRGVFVDLFQKRNKCFTLKTGRKRWLRQKWNKIWCVRAVLPQNSGTICAFCPEALELFALFLCFAHTENWESLLQFGLNYGIIAKSDMRWSERLPRKRVNFRRVCPCQSGGRVRKTSVCVWFCNPTVRSPETTHTMLVWANPVFVG